LEVVGEAEVTVVVEKAEVAKEMVVVEKEEEVKVVDLGEVDLDVVGEAEVEMVEVAKVEEMVVVEKEVEEMEVVYMVAVEEMVEMVVVQTAEAKEEAAVKGGLTVGHTTYNMGKSFRSENFAQRCS
jgi:hypothetical protein